MRTLDEVIKAFEWCLNDDNDECDECPYNTEHETDCHERNVDALHYLKEYRTTQTAYIKAMADIEDNPPLTWDELRQMEGKPVWIEEYWMPSEDEEGITEDSEPDTEKYWAIMYMGLHKILVVNEDINQHLYACDMGNDTAHQWRAYRKERE